MKCRVLFVALTIWGWGALGCGGQQEPTAPSTTETSPPPSTTEAQPTETSGGEAATAGASETEKTTLKGKVVYEGTPPPPRMIDPAERKCKAHLGGKPIPAEDLVVNNGALKWVFVYVKDGVKGKFSAPKTPVVLDQQGCTYHPHALALMTGQPLEVRNSDPLNHNIHFLGRKNPQINKSQPKAGMKFQVTLNIPEIFKIKCDVHSWMASYCGVFDHPFYSVTGDDGVFEIKDLPAGTYTVEAWHERLGTQTQEVAVKAGETGEITFTYKGAPL